MIYIENISFTSETLKRLESLVQKANKENNLRQFKRIMALLLISKKTPIAQIAEAYQVSIRSVYHWLSKFLKDRFTWLIVNNYKKNGRKKKLTDKQEKILVQLVLDGPQKCAYHCNIWNCAMIADVIKWEFNITYSPSYLPKLLKRLRLSYTKTAFAVKRTEENKKARKEWERIRLPEILKRAKELNAVLLYGDEVSFALWGSLSKTWGAVGKQVKVHTKGSRRGLKMFGVIDLFSGDFIYEEAEGRFNNVSYRNFLEKVMHEYPDRPVILIEDGAPYHSGPTLRAYTEPMAEAGRLMIERLPSYSPDHNPIEKLWKNVKKAAIHCKFFESFEDLRESVVTTFEEFRLDSSKVTCVMKKLKRQADAA